MLGLGYQQLMSVLTTWCDAIKAAGYVPGVYGSEYNLWAKISPEDLPADTLVWVAHYGKEPDVSCDLWQSSDSGSIPGYKGSVDTDEVRSAYFDGLVLKGYMSEPDKPPDDADQINNQTIEKLIAFLRSDEFKAAFKAWEGK